MNILRWRVNFWWLIGERPVIARVLIKPLSGTTLNIQSTLQGDVLALKSDPHRKIQISWFSLQPQLCKAFPCLLNQINKSHLFCLKVAGTLQQTELARVSSRMSPSGTTFFKHSKYLPWGCPDSSSGPYQGCSFPLMTLILFKLLTLNMVIRCTLKILVSREGPWLLPSSRKEPHIYSNIHYQW